MSLENLFIRVYQANYQKVYDFAYKLTSDRHRAKDIAQQCFLRLWEKMDLINSEHDDIFPLLYVIAKHIVIDESRKAARNLSAQKKHYEVGKIIGDDTEYRLYNKFLQERVHVIVQSMPENPRRVYQFRNSGYSHKEIAVFLNISVTTVRSHLKTATQLIKKKIGHVGLLLVSGLLLASCHKDVDAPAGPVTSLEVNRWILDSLQYYYYWNEGLPAKETDDGNAFQYFARLKNPADRFSILYDPNDGGTYPASVRQLYGAELTFISYAHAAQGVLGVIQLVQAGSPAASKGLHRGQVFTQVNGSLLTPANAAMLLNELVTNRQGRLTIAEINGSGQVVETGETSVAAGGATEEPAVQVSGILTEGGKKTAYLCFNYFDDFQSAAILNTFNEFKQQNVKRLVLDLRYSPGGSVAVAALLCALIGRNIGEKTVFAQYAGNKRLGKRVIDFGKAISLPEKGSPVPFAQVKAMQLSLENVYILTGPHTASAAEMVINNLKPYIQVIHIGDTTLGKDEGMVTVIDHRSPKRVDWVMLPITYKLKNANGDGDYEKGIAPRYQLDELAELPLKPLGAADDPLVAKAIELISGTSGRMSPARHDVKPEVLRYNAGRSLAYPVVVSFPR